MIFWPSESFPLSSPKFWGGFQGHKSKQDREEEGTKSCDSGATKSAPGLTECHAANAGPEEKKSKKGTKKSKKGTKKFKKGTKKFKKKDKKCWSSLNTGDKGCISGEKTD